ncbi:MAG: hypothetical protein VBE63_18300 [Lamprobacter sp.]|uniref:hypothetical protein n=1 Tax=Lamprobacter sp. TaxID=3100796 RepID=UPI002B2602D3|nr:hypothetical protein [Lamprobacter sp.]MEA3641867.1 hypothetical protein [Lamprobacter sp.]
MNMGNLKAVFERLEQRRAFLQAQREAASNQPYLLELPRGFRLHELADMATRTGHKLVPVGEGRRLRLVPIQTEVPWMGDQPSGGRSC